MANGGNNLAVPLPLAHPRKAIIFFFLRYLMGHTPSLSYQFDRECDIDNKLTVSRIRSNVYIYISFFGLTYNDPHKRYFSVWYMFTRVRVCVCVYFARVLFYFCPNTKHILDEGDFSSKQRQRSQWYNSTNGESYSFLFFDTYLFPFISHRIFS